MTNGTFLDVYLGRDRIIRKQLWHCILRVDEEPWFVGKDVATILGYSNTRDALAKHVDDEDKTDGVTIRDSIGREQNPVVINESSLYSFLQCTVRSFFRYEYLLELS